MCIYACQDVFYCKWQTTDSNLRSLKVEWFQNCLIQWLLIPVLSIFLFHHPQHIGQSSGWFIYGLAITIAAPYQIQTQQPQRDCWFLSLFLLEQEIFPRRLPADLPSHQTSLAKLPVDRHRSTSNHWQTKQWCHHESDRPTVGPPPREQLPRGLSLGLHKIYILILEEQKSIEEYWVVPSKNMVFSLHYSDFLLCSSEILPSPHPTTTTTVSFLYVY